MGTMEDTESVIMGIPILLINMIIETTNRTGLGMKSMGLRMSLGMAIRGERTDIRVLTVARIN